MDMLLEFHVDCHMPNVMLILWGILAEVTNDSHTQTVIYVFMERLFGASFASDWDCGFGIKLNLLFSSNFSFPEHLCS